MNQECVQFGKILKGIRQSLGLKQTDFARLLDMEESMISHYEAGRRQPMYSTLVKLVRKLGLNPAILFPKDGG